LEKVISAASGNLENQLVGDLVLQAAVFTLEGYLKIHEMPDADVLSCRVLLDYRRVTSSEVRCFVLGDFTPGAILVSEFDASTKVEHVGVIDWEFSGVGRGPNGDMAQIVASLRLLRIAESDRPRAHDAIQSLLQSICSSYNQNSSDLLANLRIAKEMAINPVEANSNLSIFRSALILLGREMINQAVERDCTSLHRNKTGELVRGMVKGGAWYIRRAGDDLDGMLEAANWKKILEDDDQAMLTLFGISP
jgi:hypothetical protein